MTIDWTDEKVELLKKLRAEGLSKGQIAERFECTRNAISGKLERLGLLQKQKERPLPRQLFGDRPRSKFNLGPLSAVPPRSKLTSAPTPGRRPDHIFGRSNTIKPWKAPQITPDETEYVLGLGIPLIELDDFPSAPLKCRWVINEREGFDEHLFCGAKTLKGFKYCGYHAARAYGRAG